MTKINLKLFFLTGIALWMTNCSNKIILKSTTIETNPKQEGAIFQLSLNYLRQEEDTLTIQFVITNLDSSEAHLLYSGYLYQTFNIKNDSSLLVERKILHIRFNEDEILTSANESQNCEEILAKSNKFRVLKPLSSYSLTVSQVVKGLNKKPKDYPFTVEGSIYCPKEISLYCPEIWSGKLVDTRQFKL